MRCEPWFVNTIARNPALIEYTCGIKTLDTIYLDTSFTDNVPFQTKAEGIAELLRKVAQYPKDTIFYIQAWTYGYEDVWIALSKALNSPIHVDDYKLRIFSSLTASPERSSFGSHLTPTAAALSGFMCGNSFQPGCLTANKDVRLHSCESGNMCSIARQSSVVRIQPVIASFPDGNVMHEAGIGGGGEDLERDMELEVPSTSDLHNLLEMCVMVTMFTHYLGLIISQNRCIEEYHRRSPSRVRATLDKRISNQPQFATQHQVRRHSAD